MPFVFAVIRCRGIVIPYCFQHPFSRLNGHLPDDDHELKRPTHDSMRRSSQSLRVLPVQHFNSCGDPCDSMDRDQVPSIHWRFADVRDRRDRVHTDPLFVQFFLDRMALQHRHCDHNVARQPALHHHQHVLE